MVCDLLSVVGRPSVAGSNREKPHALGYPRQRGRAGPGRHLRIAIRPLPEGTRTCFPHAKTAPQAAGPQPLHIERTTLVSLHFSGEAAFEDFRKALAEARCPIQVDIPARLIRYAQHYQPIFDSVCQQLTSKYQVQLTDLFE